MGRNLFNFLLEAYSGTGPDSVPLQLSDLKLLTYYINFFCLLVSCWALPADRCFASGNLHSLLSAPHFLYANFCFVVQSLPLLPGKQQSCSVTTEALKSYVPNSTVWRAKKDELCKREHRVPPRAFTTRADQAATSLSPVCPKLTISPILEYRAHTAPDLWRWSMLSVSTEVSRGRGLGLFAVC